MRISKRLLLALVALVLGTLTRIRTREWLFLPQVLLNEVGWLPTLMGLMAASLALLRKPRTFLTALIGLAGAALSSGSLFAYHHAKSAMDSAMVAGLGEHYEALIPPRVRARWTSPDLTPWRVLTGMPLAGSVRTVRDVVYTQTPQRPLKLDVYLPNSPPLTGERYPVIITIHGGSWRYGTKGQVWTRHHQRLAAQGYAVFDIQYRLSQEARWPAQLDDVRTAIRWVKAHATDYNADAGRIALHGRSAGAHLALSAAYRASDDCADTGVQAVVAFYPPTDLTLWDPVVGSPLDQLMGGTKLQIPDRYADASPVNFCRDGLPPTLLLQGDMDELVTPEHVRQLTHSLRETGNTVVTLHVPWGRHAFDLLGSGLGAQVTQGYVERFLAWALQAQHPSV
jgi:acetyl esterase/lipase